MEQDAQRRDGRAVPGSGRHPALLDTAAPVGTGFVQPEWEERYLVRPVSDREEELGHQLRRADV